MYMPTGVCMLRSASLHAVILSSLIGQVACDSSDPDSGNAARQADLAALCSDFEPTGLPHDARVTAREMKAGRDFDLDVCVVRGEIVSSPASTIQWAVELPSPAAWNGKSLTVGGGGFDGFIPTDADWTGAWYRGKPYARFSSDAGHQVQLFMPWGLDDVALQNHGYLANHKTLEVGTRIVADFYGKAPVRRYMVGLSNGGRAGLVAAERYPADYDGIVALAPAINQQSHQLGMLDLMRHIFSAQDNWMSPADVDLYMDAEIAACDELDGLEDGIIHNFSTCNYGAADLLCADEKTDACLTEGQLATIALVHRDHPYQVALPDGLPAAYPRFGRGGAPSGDWVDYLFGREFDNPASFNYFASDQAVKVVEGNDAASVLTHDPSEHEAGWQRLSSAIDPTARDMTAFRDRGGKLLVWYPAGDACVSIYRFAQYYDALKQSMGAGPVQEFSRFYVLPALGHELVGPGANSIDFLEKLEAWVEQGSAPDGHTAAKVDESDADTLYERPVCEFPAFPRYDGSGEPDRAESFRCSLERDGT